jgi:hypothetical protein
MNQRFYRPFIIVILALMLTPVFLFGDQERLLEARAVKRYAPCFEMNHRTMIQRCLSEAYELRLARCDTFPTLELQNSCQGNVDQELVYEKRQNAEFLKFNLWSYQSLVIWTLIGLFLLSLVKGPLPAKFPSYQRLLQQLPRTEYFAGQSLLSLSMSVLSLSLLIIFFLELAFLLGI